ncbi:MAG: two-component system response regulator NarL [Gammaproteobacteria bacterium]|nr:MAG: two-component system response regulator NarL [Gammaproteobacteria bacterium]
MPINILTIDDHALFRQCMVSYLNAVDDITVLGEAASPAQGYDMAMQLEPDIILVDLDLGGKSGMGLAEKIKQARPKSIIAMLTAHEHEDQMIRALQIGLQGYLLKDIAPDVLIQELRRMHAGDLVYPHSFLLRQTRQRISGSEKIDADRDVTDLTPREREVLQWATDGLADKEIARKLSVSENTIKNHMKNVRKKLGVNNRVKASLVAIEKGIINKSHI